MIAKHELAYGLRFAMNFPEFELGDGLEEFIETADAQFYCQHLMAVAHNRRWLAGVLFKQRRFDEAVAILLGAEEAEQQLLIVEGLLTNHCPDVEDA